MRAERRKLDAYLARIGIAGRRSRPGDADGGAARATGSPSPSRISTFRSAAASRSSRPRSSDKLVTGGAAATASSRTPCCCAALKAIGFEARPLLARVWLRPTRRRRAPTPSTSSGSTDRLHRRCRLRRHVTSRRMMLRTTMSGNHRDGARHRLLRDAEHGWMLERDAGDGLDAPVQLHPRAVWPADLETRPIISPRPGPTPASPRCGSPRARCPTAMPRWSTARSRSAAKCARGQRDRQCRRLSPCTGGDFRSRARRRRVRGAQALLSLTSGPRGRSGRREMVNRRARGLAMLAMVHVHDEVDLARRGGAAIERVSSDDRAERADARRAAARRSRARSRRRSGAGRDRRARPPARRPAPDSGRCRADARRRRR